MILFLSGLEKESGSIQVDANIASISEHPTIYLSLIEGECDTVG